MDDPPGMFTMTDMQEHAQRRKIFAKAFSVSQLRLQWEGTVKQTASLAVNRIKEEAKREGSANTMKWWTCMTADVSGQLMFGEDFHNLQTGKVSAFQSRFSLLSFIAFFCHISSYSHQNSND